MNVATGGGPSQTNPSSAPPASIPSGAVTERRRRTLIRVTVLAFACAKRVVELRGRIVPVPEFEILTDQ